MAIHVIKMPDIGEGIAEVEVVEWHVQPGDTVHEDQVLAEVMTDKATVEIPSPVAGKVLSRNGEVGQVMAVGSELIRLDVAGAGGEAPDEGEGSEAALPVGNGAATGRAAAASEGASPADGVRAQAGTNSAQEIGSASAAAATPDAGAPVAAGQASVSPPAPAPATPDARAPVEADDASVSPRAPAVAPSRPPTAAAAATGKVGDRPIASPAVRRRAWELGIDLSQVPASGAGGRIMQDDLDDYAASGPAPAPGFGPGASARPGSTGYAERNDEQAVPVVGLRRKVAQKMQESKRHIPHFTYVEELDVTEIEALRKRLNTTWGAQRGRLTLLPFLVRAVVLAVREFPQVNARFDDATGIVTRYGAVHLGIATQTDAGLMVPVLRHAEARDLWSAAAEIARLAHVARIGKATREELSGSTITITSLGALGGIVSTPVINHPEVAIVGINRIVERPVIRHGAVVARDTMNLSSSFDHRVIDGLHAAEFVQRLRGYLECPATLFVE